MLLFVVQILNIENSSIQPTTQKLGDFILKNKKANR